MITQGFVYFIHSVDFSHYYIGSTNNPKIRFKHHKTHLKLNKHCNDLLQRSFNKYGDDYFLYSIAEKLGDRNSASKVEQGLLDFHFRKPGCLNVSSNGIMSAQCPDVIALRNKTLKSPEHRNAASIAAKEWRTKNPEIALANDKKRLQARVGDPNWKSQNAKRVKKISSTEEAINIFKKRIEKFYANGGVNAMSKPVIQIFQDGTEITYVSASVAIKANPGVHANSISRCCKKIGKTAGGFKWRFA